MKLLMEMQLDDLFAQNSALDLKTASSFFPFRCMTFLIGQLPIFSVCPKTIAPKLKSLVEMQPDNLFVQKQFIWP